MPTLPYPEQAYRPEGIRGDPSLPTYELAPPKYEYGHLENGTPAPAPAPAATEGQPEMQEAPRPAGQMHLVTTPAASPSIERREPVLSAPTTVTSPSAVGEMETVPLGDAPRVENETREQRSS